MRKWKNANKKQPKKSGKYLVLIDEAAICVEYSKKHNLFNYSDLFEDEFVKELALYPTYWMELPKFPKKVR